MDHLAAGIDDATLAAGCNILDADRTRALKANPQYKRPGLDDEIRALPRRPQISARGRGSPAVADRVLAAAEPSGCSRLRIAVRASAALRQQVFVLHSKICGLVEFTDQ